MLSDVGREHLIKCHARRDGARVLCTRCFFGFKSRDELRKHSQAEVVCQSGKFDPKVGLHEEAINLLRGRENAGRGYLAHWKEICNVVFQTDEFVIEPGE